MAAMRAKDAENRQFRAGWQQILKFKSALLAGDLGAARNCRSIDAHFIP
jgi:hypothetical protein